MLLTLTIALILDLIIGDPQTRLHPVRGIAALNCKFESLYRRLLAKNLRLAGIATQASVLGLISLLCYTFLRLCHFHPFAQAIILYISISPRDLYQHIVRIAKALEKNELKAARFHCSMIVRRDTENLDESQLSRAAIESVSENSVDGTTAALFYFFLFGPIGAILYRASNTLDSMFGYKNKRYKDFGYSSAKSDDILNFIPARITGLCICLASAILRFHPVKAFTTMLRDGRKSSSPTSAITEAAIAGALDITLGGPTFEKGLKCHEPIIGNARKKLNSRDIRNAIKICYLAILIFISIMIPLTL